jgi:hypothetical protein
MSKPRRLNQTELAKYFGCNQSAISAQAKQPDAPALGPDRRYSLTEWVKFRRHQEAMNKAKPSGSYGEELRAKVAAQRALLELELEVKRGSLLERDTVERHQREFVQVVTNGLLNAPQPLSLLVANKPPAECAKVIREFNRRMLEGWQKMNQKGGGE